jgi:membrane-bound lytic murein transglycosylase D
MLRMHLRLSVLPYALLLAATAACAGAPARPVLPAPMDVPASEPAPPAPGPVAAEEPAPAPRTWNGMAGPELLGGASYDLPVEANQLVASEVSFLVNERHDVVARWLERSERYAAFVRETFAAAGLPRDLHHLAMVESGYQPTVRSRAGAVGMWQFMASTGRGMGLRIDDTVDERMDPVRSTRAAARHLRQLWSDFGRNWPLAAAAYNAGGGRIRRGVQSVGARSFWELAERGTLAQETRRYVPRLFAVTIIAKDPERFGYAPASGPVRRLEFDSVKVDLATPLPVLARLGGTSPGELAELNPHLHRGVAPAFYWIWVPKGSGPAAQQAYRESAFRRRGGFSDYLLRAGEDVASIGLAANMTLSELRELNPGVPVDAVASGSRVRLYADAVRALAARPVERVARTESDGSAGATGPRLAGQPVAAPRDDSAGSAAPVLAGRPVGQPQAEDAARLAEHVVRPGETLWSIARTYATSVEALRGANGMRPDSVIQAGQTLRIPRAADAGPR